VETSLRADLAAAAFALCPSGFASFVWIVMNASAQASAGLPHKISLRGDSYYLSDAASTGLVLSIALIGLGVLSSFLFAPKAGPRRIAVVAFRPRRAAVIFAGSTCLCLAGAAFGGPTVTEWLVRRGVVLGLFWL
jgi:hypothetical protein